MMQKSEYPNKKIAKRVDQSRKIGLGHMGFADALIKMKIPYTSEEAINFASNVGQTIIDACVRASHELGKTEGCFPLMNSYRIPKHIKHALQRENIKEKDYKPANSTLTTIAPTGTISILADCSSGIEPIFYLEQIENRAEEVIKHIHPLYAAWKERNPDTQKPNYFQDLHDIDYATHVAIQSTFQRFICSGVSKTVGLPNDATHDTVAQIIHEAYYTGCKGITIYRDGSKANQVISDSNGISYPSLGEKIIPHARPEVLSGTTYQIKTGYGHMLVTINSLAGEPFEIICQLGKSGASEMAKAEAISRLASMLLRCSVDPMAIVDQLERIVGGSPIFDQNGTIYSIPDAVAKVLKRHLSLITETTVPHMMKCPECGSHNLQAEGSCTKCLNCGWKSCG
jgi:ribonucleoside-diphosphate reductase alpha chain